MPELTTCCPSCKVSFQVTEAQLQAAGGKVRCGLCQQVFNALEHNSDTSDNSLDVELDDDLLIYDDMPLPGEPNKEPNQEQLTTESEPPEQDLLISDQQEDLLPIPDIASADLEEPQIETPTKKKRPWLLLLLVIFSCGILAGQYVHFNADKLAENPAYRPWINRLCSFTGCNANLKNIAKISTSNLVIQSHPSSANALKVSLVLLNEANYKQPFPNLVLIFENLNGATIASRQFSPQEYLEGGLKGSQNMPINQPVYVELEIVDPGEQAQSYSLLLN